MPSSHKFPVWPSLLLWMLLPAAVAFAAESAPPLPSISELSPLPDFVDASSVPEQWPASFDVDSDSSWRYWLIDTQVDRRTSDDTIYVDLAFEPMTAERLGDAGRFEIGFRSEYQSLQLHQIAVRRAGRWADRFRPEGVELTRRQAEFESDLSDSSVSALLVIDDVRVGDVVRISYSVHGSNPVLAGHSHHQFSFGSEFPQLHRKARVLFAKDAKVNAQSFNEPPKATLKRRSGHLEWRAEAKALPGVRREQDLPSWYVDRPAWAVSKDQSWAQIVDWALPLYLTTADLPDELAQELPQKRLLTEAERASWALQRVQDDVRYFATVLGDSSHRPNPPALTWQRRYGDCKDKAQLLTTLLRALDIEAMPALVSVGNGPNLDRLPPAATAFDHVIVTAIVDGERLWLDPTLVWQRGHVRDRRAGLEGHALIIDVGQKDLTAMPAADPTQYRIAVSERYSVADEDRQTVALTVETRRSGDAANEFRRALAGSTSKEIQRKYAEFYRRHFGKLRTTAELGIADDVDANEIVVSEHYELQDPWTRGDLQLLLVPTAAEAAAQLVRPGQLERAGPFIATAPASIDYEARIELPESWQDGASELDESVDSPAFRWRSWRKSEADGLALGHHFESLQTILPAADIDQHLAAIERAEHLSQQGLRVLMPAQQRIQDREARLRAILKSARSRAQGGEVHEQ